MALTLVLQGILLSLAYWFTIGRRGLSWRELGFVPLPGGALWSAAGVAVGAHVLVITYSVIVNATGVDALAPEQGLEGLFESPALLPLVGVVTVLTTPVVEETFFRGFVFGGLTRSLGVGGAAVASGFLFAAFHVSTADTAALVIPFTVVGVALALLYNNSGSLWSAIFAHFVFNLVSFIGLVVVVSS